MKTEIVWCTNLLCKAAKFKIELDERAPLEEQLKKIVCPKCGNIGVMLSFHVLNSDEIMRQITGWKNIVLYRKAFKAINYKKLPKNKEQQMFIGKKKNTDTRPITRR